MRQKKAQNGMIKKQNKGTRDGKALVDFMERCYRLYEQKMYRAAYRILQDSAWAEDAVQEAFLKLMKGQVYFEDACSDDCKKYMITVIRHSAIDIYNQKKESRIFYVYAMKFCTGNRHARRRTAGAMWMCRRSFPP